MPLTIAATNLSLGNQGDDITRIHQALQSLGRTIPADEADASIFGPGTAAVVRAFQTDSGVDVTGVVDAATVKAIRAALKKLGSNARVIRGRVVNADGDPATGLVVQAYVHTPAGEKTVGKSSLNAEGGYEIWYKVPAKTASVDLRVEVRDTTAVVETTPPATSLVTSAGPLEVVDFVLSGDAHPPGSEFDRLSAALKPLLGSRNPAELKEDDAHRDVSVLAGQSGQAPGLVSAFVAASRIAGTSKIPPAVVYGLIREGLPADLPALQATHETVQQAALQSAVRKGTVPSTLDGKSIESYLSAVTPEPTAQLKSLLGKIVKPSEMNRFVETYLKSDNVPGFWKHLSADPTFAARAETLRFTVQLAGLTDHHEPLVAAVIERGDVKQASDLARLTASDWKSLINARGVGVPPETPGDTANDKTSAYVGQTLSRVEAAFPTQFFAARLGASPLAKFLDAHPTYDLKRTYPTRFFKQNPAASQALTAEDRSRLQNLQRVYRLTGNAEETIALTGKGIGSAQQITELSRVAFVEQQQNLLAPERAAAIYNRALRASTLALAVFGENAASMNRTGLPVLPRLDSEKQAELAATNPIPDWQTLFGSFDACACKDCASVHGAAAYLVDALQFLKARGVQSTLFARRPDLGEIELSCQNTDTPLPLIDLANEILEDAIAAPPAFTPFTLAPGLESDLSQSTATAALRAAFSPALTGGASVEEIEPGARWRIWDRPYAFTVESEGGVSKAATRSRQTRGSSSERRAAPQYRNDAAYDVVAGSVYPWSLPFDLANAEAKAFLNHLGVPRRDLIEVLRPVPEPFDVHGPVVQSLAAEGLGLTDVERRIIAGLPLNPPQPLEAFWGSKQLADLTTVRALLDAAGLTYAELEQLLDTRFVNPGQIVSLVLDAGALDSCDTTKLRPQGLTDEVLERKHRFVRLQRRLAWPIADLDRAICALSPDPEAPLLDEALLVRLDHLNRVCERLRLSVPQVLAFWRPIDTTEPGSLYRSLFLNPAISPTDDGAFALRPDGEDLAQTGGALLDHAAELQAAFRLDAAALTMLIARTDGTLTLSNLSHLYRHAILARQLTLSVAYLLIAIELTGIDPFQRTATEDTLRLIDAITKARNSGFDWPQLDYLLRHRFSSAAAFVPAESTLAQTLMELRTALSKIDASSDAEKQQLLQSAVIDRLSDALSLPADVTASLLTRVTHSGAPAAQRLLEVSGISASDPIARANAGPQFETLEKLLKGAAIINTLEMPGSQLDWLLRENEWLTTAPDPLSGPIPFTSWFSLVQLQRLRRDLALQDGAVEGLLSALTAVSAATDTASRTAAKQRVVTALSTWLGWSAAEVETLIGKAADVGDLGLWDVRFPLDYRVELLTRLHRALTSVNRLGVTAAEADAWCAQMVTAAQAQAIRGKAKSKYDEVAWQEIVTPLQDTLRQQQRDALLAQLSESSATTGPHGDADDLYAHFLVDVQMCSCQLTSRIKQALSSVQLFAQRCLMGLEAGVQANDADWQQWTDWMKNFRVWEANRKIWLYPENWIEPELRDDKTPFFRDLENELQQSDLDNAAAEQALMNYVRNLEQVAHLEVAGTYEDVQDDGRGNTIKTIHVFARTYNSPRLYFYRRKDGTTQSWTPWEKVELDIEGDHLLPVVWNRRLMLIWPIFSQKQEEKAVKMPGPGQSLGSGTKYWQIQLAWSELQYGRWSGKQLTEPVTLSASVGNPNVRFGDFVGPPLVTTLAKPAGTLPPPAPGGSGPGGGGGTPPGGALTQEVTTLVSPDLITFKAFPSEAALVVRGYMRLDYAGLSMSGGPGYAYPFGEFRFAGCRKIVTSAHRRQMVNETFALAPQGTQFDAMWFDQRGFGLTMLDGTFPVRRSLTDSVLDVINIATPLPQDASALSTQAINIPVLGASPSTFRLLAPHQDLQFIGDRPFFYLDTQRTFVISSTGHSRIVVNPTNWVVGDLATLGMRARLIADEPAPPPPSSSALTLLVPNSRGVRVAQSMTAIDVTPTATMTKALPRFWSDRAYTFRNFSHPWVCWFVQRLEQRGIDTLLSLDTQEQVTTTSFQPYVAQACVAQPHPIDEIEFAFGGTYDQYNWELFFHVPLLIATRLTTNQRFAEAQRWFHYIFDPTGRAPGSGAQRFWRMKPFHDRAADDYEEQSVHALEALAASGPPASLSVAVDQWRNNPFDPYAVARLRTTAFQKTVVMKYIDNLIAWGDQLFRLNTLESINEATQLYVLAAGILGRRPEAIERKVHAPVRTYNNIGQLGPLSNALEQLELLIGTGDEVGDEGTTGEDNAPGNPPKILYFCVQENSKLAGYWDTVTDRLFKIRHCMNIEGQVQQLPLFEPPIDPALLVRARAAGLSIAEVLSDISSPIGNYRFAVMMQKANELVVEVRNLGTQLLSVLDRHDAEGLSVLRSGQEVKVLQALQDIRNKQIDEATKNLEALQKSSEMAQAKKAYFSSREFMSAGERAATSSLDTSRKVTETKYAAQALAAIIAKIGNIKVGGPTTAGIEVGSTYFAFGLSMAVAALDTTASVHSAKSQLQGRMAEYERRKDEWDYQSSLADIELKQIDKHLTAAQIRLAIAERELATHDQQTDNARAIDDLMRAKFTNVNLHQWAIGQVSALYFQAYQLAYDLARRAERCMQHELGLEDGATSFIRFGYWDSLKKGLLAGDRLAHDLKRLDAAYLDANVREYELTKHVSLVSLAPSQLIALKETGSCTFEIPEWLFDLDTPGHFRRRLKMVSLTIPCVVGPYMTIHCKVQLVKSSYRQNTDTSAGYERLPADTLDSRFVDDRRVVSDMVTSTAQNDAGLFEPSMRDERYLPFEGAGAVSTWRLELSNEFRMFDYSTITDVILHLRYTARHADTLRDVATTAVRNQLADVTAAPLVRLFSVRHEFPNEWHRFTNSPQAIPTAMILNLATERFPFFVQGRAITLRQATVMARASSGPLPGFAIAPGSTPATTASENWSGAAAPGQWTLSTSVDPKSVDDVFVIVSFTA